MASFWRKTLGCCGLLCLGGMFFMQQALAQEGKNTQEKKTHQLDEVTVSAGKTKDLDRDLPFSMMVFTGGELEDRGVRQIDQLTDLTPNVSYQKFDTHKTELNYRGIGAMTSMTVNWNTNLDGVLIPYAGLDTFFDVEQVEVVRGGMGSLYGRNNHAGLINILTRDPGGAFNGEAGLTYGDFNTFTGNAALGGPINQKWGFRLAGRFSTSDGWIENTYLGKDDANNSKQYSGRAKLVFRPSPGFKAAFSLNADSYDDANDSFSKIINGPSKKTQNNLSGFHKGNMVVPIFKVAKEIGDLVLTSITGFSSTDYDFLLDQDATFKDVMVLHYQEKYETVSQELRLCDQRGQGRLDWMAGLFLMHEKADFATHMGMGDDAWSMGAYPGMYQKADSQMTTINAALFGRLDWRLTRAFKVTAGLRLDYDQRELNWTGLSGMPGMTMPAEKITDSQDWLEALPRLSLSYKLVDDQNIYATISRGYRAGDFAAINTDFEVVQKPVDPEYTMTYEAGYKALLADGSLTLNTAVFYVDWRDMQLSAVVQGKDIRQNAGSAQSYGFEADLRYRVMPGWDIYGAAGWLNAEFDEYGCHPTGNDLSGKTIPNTPEYKFVIGSRLRHDTGLFAQADLSLIGKQHLDEQNLVEQDAYPLVNAKVGYESTNWAVYLFGRNLGDEDYLVRAFNMGSYFFGRSGEPRMIGIEFKGYF